MPEMAEIVSFVVQRHRSSKRNLTTIDISTPVQVVVGHPLKKVLEMCFVWLEHLFHNHTLTQKVCQPRHNHRIQHVHFQVISVSNMKSIKWDAFDKSDACDKFSVSIVQVPPVADREGIVD